MEETLSPLIPLSLRAIKGEGERRTEADAGADAPASASSSILGRREEMAVGKGLFSCWVSFSILSVGRGLAMEGPGLVRWVATVEAASLRCPHTV